MLLLLGIAAYFLLACAVLAWAFLPPARAWASTRARRWRAAAGGTVVAGRRGVARRAAALAAAGRHARRGAARRAPRLAAGLAVLALPVLVAVVLHDRRGPSTYDPTRAPRGVDERVAMLLDGERLVPPPALPPEVFTTPEVEAARPSIGDASREWRLLDDDFRRRLLVVFRLLQERHGYEPVLLEGYRSPERQARLAALGPAVTRAGAFQSYHQFGLAADVAFRRDGVLRLRETDPWTRQGYDRLGELAAAAGLVWGGGWTRLKDLGHVELRRPGVLRTIPEPDPQPGGRAAAQGVAPGRSVDSGGFGGVSERPVTRPRS